MIFNTKPVAFLATGCFVGYIPYIPGTFGSLVGLIPVFFLSKIDKGPAMLIILAFGAISIYIADRASRQMGGKDPGCIVIDEIAGILVVFWGIPLCMESILAGFLLFRFFDGIKPPPIGLLDRKLEGGLGIMADDLAAGIFSNLILRLLLAAILTI